MIFRKPARKRIDQLVFVGGTCGSVKVSCERINGKNNAARGQVVAGKNDEKVRRRKRKRRTRLQEEEQELMAASGGSGR